MSIKGKFDDITLPDVFQVISIGKKSGKLVISAEKMRAVIIFDQGNIVQASIDGYKKTIGRLLLQRNFITKSQLSRALEIQNELDEWKQLGTICVEQGYITRVQLEEAVKTLMAEIIMELLTWREGDINFEAGESGMDDEISLDMKELVIRSGISSDSLLMEGAKMLDERIHSEGFIKIADKLSPQEVEARERRKKKVKDGWLTSFARGVLEDIDVSFLEDLSDKIDHNSRSERKLTGSTRIYAEIRELKSRLKSVDEKYLWQEFCFSLMKFASGLIGRVLLFVVKDGKAYGAGQMGLREELISLEKDIRSFKIPLDENSFLKDAYDAKNIYCEQAKNSRLNNSILEKIGCSPGRDVLVIPIVINDDVRFLIYADNHPSDESMTNIEQIESFIYQANMALEIALLERSLKK